MEIPYTERLEIKMMVQYLYDIDPDKYAWAQKFLTKEYLATSEEWEDFLCNELEDEHRLFCPDGVVQYGL